MIYQISSGQGPAECELGVAKFLAYLQKYYKISVLETSQGYYENTVQVLTALVTSARTGFWILAVVRRPKLKFLTRNKCCLKPFAAAARAGRT